ncbi:MAG: hypothetical protein HKN72_08225 [Gemmatimonadetes bacterium]|nr:hypothetical protein [Gemmatimonadota bacterium]
MRSQRTVVALAVAVLTATACQLPRFEGPEIQEPPANFQRQADNYPPRRVFPEQPVSMHAGWVHADVAGVSIIYLDEHPTVLDMDEIMAAREAAQAAETDPDAVYRNVEALTIDGRDAWGWYRTIESPRRGLEQVTYTAVVPYDSVSYAIQFTSSEPSLKRAAPDTLRTILSSFGIGRTTYNLPLIAIVFGAMLLSVSVVRSKRQARADRLRSINFVTLKKDEDGSADGLAGSSGAPGQGSKPGESAAAKRPPTPTAE